MQNDFPPDGKTHYCGGWFLNMLVGYYCRYCLFFFFLTLWHIQMSASCLLNSLTCGMSFQLMAFLPWFEYLRKYTSERFQFVSISLINFSRPTCCMHSEHAQWIVFCVWCMESGSSLILLWMAQHRGKCLLWSMGMWASFPVSLVENLLVKKGHSGVEGTGAWEDS